MIHDAGPAELTVLYYFIYLGCSTGYNAINGDWLVINVEGYLSYGCNKKFIYVKFTSETSKNILVLSEICHGWKMKERARTTQSLRIKKLYLFFEHQ